MNKGFIYKISSPSIDKIYIGSTQGKLNVRLNRHKITNDGCSSEEIVKYDDAIIELIEEIQFTEKEELLWRERYYIELYKTVCVNRIIPIKTDEEKKQEKKIRTANNYQKNKEKIKEYKKKWVEQNREKLKEYKQKYLKKKKRELKTI
tara:strand:+ start:783 stop:1226 length:444 start_codon:yes stop_codon:yes gene_type:complete